MNDKKQGAVFEEIADDIAKFVDKMALVMDKHNITDFSVPLYCGVRSYDKVQEKCIVLNMSIFEGAKLDCLLEQIDSVQAQIEVVGLPKNKLQ